HPLPGPEPAPLPGRRRLGAGAVARTGTATLGARLLLPRLGHARLLLAREAFALRLPPRLQQPRLAPHAVVAAPAVFLGLLAEVGQEDPRAAERGGGVADHRVETGPILLALLLVAAGNGGEGLVGREGTGQRHLALGLPGDPLVHEE